MLEVHRGSCYINVACVSYIEMWERNFKEVESFSWISQNDVKWPEVETAAELVKIKMGY